MTSPLLNAQALIFTAKEAPFASTFCSVVGSFGRARTSECLSADFTQY